MLCDLDSIRIWPLRGMTPDMPSSNRMTLQLAALSLESYSQKKNRPTSNSALAFGTGLAWNAPNFFSIGLAMLAHNSWYLETSSINIGQGQQGMVLLTDQLTCGQHLAGFLTPPFGLSSPVPSKMTGPSLAMLRCCMMIWVLSGV